MDTDAVVGRIDAYIDAATHFYDAKIYLGDNSSEYEQQLTTLAEPLASIARAVGRDDLVTDLTPALTGLAGYDWSSVKTAAVKLRTHIMEGAALAAELGPSGPSLSAGQMHDRVWRVAAPHWDDGDHALAVREAGRAVALYARKRVGRSDDDGTELVGQSLAAADPKPGKPRLRLPVPAGVSDDTARSIQEGAAAFGRGCMMAIRNVHTHDEVDLDEDVALEMLAALSLLTRWVEAAEVVSVDD